MFEAFVLVCLFGKPIEPFFCEELGDARGPYKTIEECKVRVKDITFNLPNHRPHMQSKGYSCSYYIPPKKIMTK